MKGVCTSWTFDGTRQLAVAPVLYGVPEDFNDNGFRIIKTLHKSSSLEAEAGSSSPDPAAYHAELFTGTTYKNGPTFLLYDTLIH